MELTFKEITFLASPIMLVQGNIAEVPHGFFNKLEIDGSYVVNGRISRQSATKTRFEYFSEKTEGKSADNWGYVKVSDVRRSVDFEIGVEDEIFENLLRALTAFGPQNAKIEANFALSEFVPDIRDGRGAILDCAPQLWVKEWIKA